MSTFSLATETAIGSADSKQDTPFYSVSEAVYKVVDRVCTMYFYTCDPRDQGDPKNKRSYPIREKGMKEGGVTSN